MLVLGLLGLWGGTLLAIRGAVLLAEKHGWSQGFVGLTVMSIGTDLPELFIAVDASVQQLQGVEASGIIVGNAIGSTMAQATLVVGAAGLARYLSVAPSMVRRDGTTLLLATLMVVLLGSDGAIDRLEGSVLLIGYALYLIALSQSRRGQEADQPGVRGVLPPSLLVFIGLATVILASHVSVTEGVALVESWGMSQTMVGVLILGLGTSLPELALSVGAARQGHGSLAVGNAIGSCVFDMMVPLGLAATMHPLLVGRETLIFDLPALALGSTVLLFFLFRKKGLQRREAWSLLVLYGVYVVSRTIVG